MGFLDSKIKTFENGKQVIEMPDSVNFIVVTSDKYIMLSSQWRASTGTKMLNCFGGYIDEGEEILDAACRELYEETNLTINDLTPKITVVYSNQLVSAGYTTEKNSLLILHSKHRKNELEKIVKCNDEHEDIEFEFLSIRKAKKMNYEGLKTSLAIHFVREGLWSKFLGMLGK